MIGLIYNEQLKIFRKKKLFVILIILALTVPIFTYANLKQIEAAEKQLGTTDWKVKMQQNIVDLQNRLSSSQVPANIKSYLKIQLSQEQYYLDHNINPQAPGAVTFTRVFAENAIVLLVPLLIMVVAADIISSEVSGGQIKFLLTRPVSRWRILCSKYIALILSVSFVVFGMAFISYILSGIVFGYSGWNLPMLIGFSSTGDTLNTAHVHLIPQWKYTLMEYGLVWFVGMVVGVLTLMFSVLIRSTAAVMGLMLAALISGAILMNMVATWNSAKYFFMVNLELTDYIHGSKPPIEGMTLHFSIIVLAVWMLVSIVISFLVFTRRDIY